MKEKKLQIFVSSTFKDLIEERQAAVEAILSSGHIPAGMELFSAGDESQMTVIKRWIDESDIYLLILGGRYGSIERTTGKSYTQLEFEYALERKKPLFAIVISDNALNSKVKLHGIEAMEQENQQSLTAFKNLVLQNLVKFWDDTKDIKIAIHETLSEFSFRKDLIGWIRGDNSINTGFLAEQIARLTNENSDLRNQLNKITLESNTNYAGLSYSQMKELLKRHEITSTTEIEETNLYDFFINRGEQFSKGYSKSHNNMDQLDKLVLFKLIQKAPPSMSTETLSSLRSYYTFTEDGQNFYLKSIFSYSG